METNCWHCLRKAQKERRGKEGYIQSRDLGVKLVPNYLARPTNKPSIFNLSDFLYRERRFFLPQASLAFLLLPRP